ncbi:hypothetical protein HanRHA438_Chr09g0386971 [Helianthus annuus]|nr:hypothetical protein HanIR_Chr09g0404611 [Helianthus annuus]KAJ0887105.1 hypothetical protein HanRHA438_Chr09g0386971 [Helianthus annuus]
MTLRRSFSSSTNTFSGTCSLNSYSWLFSTPSTDRYLLSHSLRTTRSCGITANSLLLAYDFMFTCKSTTKPNQLPKVSLWVAIMSG